MSHAPAPTPSRPRVLIAMAERTEADVLTPELRERLDAVADVAPVRARQDFADPEVRAELARTDVLLTGWGCPRISGAVVDAAPRLRAVVHSAGSVKGFIDPDVFARDLVFTNAVEANAVPVAEYTFATIVLAAKRAFTQQARLRHPVRDSGAVPPVGTYGRTVGVLGASRVGRLVVERLRSLDVRILLHDPYLDDAEATALGAEPCGLEDLFRRSDIVTLHAPLTEQTEGMVTAELLALIPDHGILVNTARGGLVDHAALERECAAGRLDAVLDVTTPEPLPPGSTLLELENVFVTPHIAGALGSEVARLGALAVAEIELVAAGRPPRHPVSLNELARLA